MGNIIQTSNKGKDCEDTAMAKKSEQVQLFKANPVLTMFLKFVEKLGNQVRLFKAKHDFIVSDYVKKVEQHAQLVYEKYVLPVFYKFVESFQLMPQQVEPQEAENEMKSAALIRVYALGGFFILKWAWERWIQPRADDSGDDE